MLRVEMVDLMKSKSQQYKAKFELIIVMTQLYVEIEIFRDDWKLEKDQSQDTEPTYDEYNSEHLSQEPANTGLVNPTFEEGKVEWVTYLWIIASDKFA